jgi:hypothetical protein
MFLRGARVIRALRGFDGEGRPTVRPFRVSLCRRVPLVVVLQADLALNRHPVAIKVSVGFTPVGPSVSQKIGRSGRDCAADRPLR